MFKLRHKPPKPEEGFSLIEVLVTALVLVGFLLGGLQAITLATLLRVQAQAKSEAVNWINNDKTKIEYEAFDVGDGFTPPSDDPDCTLSNFRTTLQGTYPGTTLTSSTSSTVVNFQTTNPPSIELVNKNTYRVARIYTLIPNATNPTTLQITWHLWDEGTSIINGTSNTQNPNLDGTGGDADDRSISVMTTEVVPNIANCN